jgi:hypothetical protein
VNRSAGALLPRGRCRIHAPGPDFPNTRPSAGVGNAVWRLRARRRAVVNDVDDGPADVHTYSVWLNFDKASTEGGSGAFTAGVVIHQMYEAPT